MSSLHTLIAAPPSGRTRPLLIDADRYATEVVRQGAPIPWTDLALVTGHVAQVTSLLGPDAVWIDVAAWYAAYTATAPDLVTDMGARTRAGYALRTLLGHEQAAGALHTTVRTIAASSRRQLVLHTPSPACWLRQAHALAGTPLEEVDEDQADSASMYLAEWLGHLGSLPVALVLLDARRSVSEPDGMPVEHLAAYTALTNVAGHFAWTLALRTEDGIEVGAGEPTIGILDECFWITGAGIPDGEVIVADIPPTARPEHVLDQLAALR